MKAFKRIFASVMVTAMLATMGVSAFADDIQPRADLCTKCGSGVMVEEKEYGEWHTIGFPPCEHGDPTKNDTLKEREVEVYYVCTNCGISFFSRSYTETILLHI